MIGDISVCISHKHYTRVPRNVQKVGGVRGLEHLQTLSIFLYGLNNELRYLFFIYQFFFKYIYSNKFSILSLFYFNIIFSWTFYYFLKFVFFFIYFQQLYFLTKSVTFIIFFSIP